MNTNEFTQQKIEELLEQEFQEIKGGGSDNGDQESCSGSCSSSCYSSCNPGNQSGPA